MPVPHKPAVAGAILLALAALPLGAQDGEHNSIESAFGTYGDNGLPFFGQTLDARGLGERWPKNNLTPRGIVLHLGAGVHACFDPDLLRVALVWQEDDPGEYLTMNGMAPGSYRQPNRKAGAGQEDLPAPIGTPLAATPLVPGCLAGAAPRRTDPREPAVDEAEVGRGPLPGGLGRWIGLRLDQDGATLLYDLSGARIEEKIRATHTNQALQITRLLRVGPHGKTLRFVQQNGRALEVAPAGGTRIHGQVLAPHGKVASWRTMKAVPDEFIDSPPPRRWKETVAIATRPATGSGPYLLEEVPLPVPNPWKRNVRPVSFDFFPDGRLAMVTFDGDVWIADGVRRSQNEIRWSRFAGGLHEPMGLRIENGRILVFDRNGITRLNDRDGNGEADFYENVSNIAAQTAETREFALGFELKPGGGYYLSKGGQVASTRGKLNGTVVEISPEAGSLGIIATGLRQPFIGVDPLSGLITASDQQGHWVPATPLHVIRRGEYYGFQPSKFKDKAVHPKKITEPPLWIPHFVNQSGARQVWLRNARMGSLNDSLVHIGYNRPAIFKVYLDRDSNHDVRQGAVAPILDGFSTGLLDGRVNPRDGFLYVGGLNIWGSVGKKIRGLYRVRPGESTAWVPEEVRSFEQGILLRFGNELEEAIATGLANYTVDRWNYRRSHNYGSGHYKLDGTPGQESLPVTCAYLSTDRRAVFLGIPGMKEADTLRVTYIVPDAAAGGRVQSAYLTVRALVPLDLPSLGFEHAGVDLTVKGGVGPAIPHPEPSAAEGRKVAGQFGCVACHSTDGSKVLNPEPSMVVGPSWRGLYGSQREFADGTIIKRADEVYLREAILDPATNVTKGFETGKTGVGMPSYLGVLRDDQIDSIILYIKSLAR